MFFVLIGGCPGVDSRVIKDELDCPILFMDDQMNFFFFKGRRTFYWTHLDLQVATFVDDLDVPDRLRRPSDGRSSKLYNGT